MLEEEEELQKLMSVQDLMMDEDENAFAVSSVPCTICWWVFTGIEFFNILSVSLTVKLLPDNLG